MIYILIFLYFIVNVSNDLTDELKNEIKNLFNSKIEYGLNEITNVKTVINSIYLKYSLTDLSNLLINVIEFYNYNNELFYYCIPKKSLITKDERLDKDFVFDTWLQLFAFNFNSYKIHSYKNEIKQILNKLSLKDKYDLAILISKKWINEEGKINRNPKNNKFLSFYELRVINDNRFYDDSVKFLNSLKSDFIKEYLESITNDNEGFMINFIEKLKSSFNKILKPDDSLNLTNEPLNFESGIINKIENPDPLLNYFKFDINQVILKKLFSILTIDDNNSIKEKLNKLKIDNCFRTSNINLLKLNIGYDDIYKLLDIEQIDVFSDKSLVFDKDSIIFKIEFIKDKSTERELNEYEINNIIDSKHKVTETLYKFNYGDYLNTVFVTRDEVSRLVYKHYKYITIAYRFIIIPDDKNIIFIKNY